VSSCRRWWPGSTAVVAALTMAAAAQWVRRSLRSCRGFRGLRVLRQGGPAARGRGAVVGRGRGTLGTSAPLSRSGNRRGPWGPDSRGENARGHHTSSTGTQGEGAGVPGGRARRDCLPSSDLRPRCRSGRGLELAPGRSRWPGRWKFLGLPRWGLWVGLALARVVSQRRAGGLAAGLVGWGLGFLLMQGLRPPPSILGPTGGPWRWSRRTSGVPVGRRV
jgi:hypothetical protein